MQGTVGNDQGFLIQLKARLLIEANQIWHENIGEIQTRPVCSV